MRMSLAMALLLALASLPSCGVHDTSSDLALIPLTETQRAADIDQLLTQIRTLYAPLKFKEDRFKFDFEKLAVEYRAQAIAAKTDDEFYAAVAQLVANFQDGHVSVKIPASAATALNISILAVPVEDKALVGTVGPELAEEGISVGDEIFAVDGVKAMDYLPLFTAHKRLGNDLSDKHAISSLFKRPNHFRKSITLASGEVVNAQPSATKAKVEFKRADGTSYVRDLVWRKVNAPSNQFEFAAPSVAKNVYAANAAEIIQERTGVEHMGALNPFFVTPQTKGVYKFRTVTVIKEDEATLRQLELKVEDVKDIYAALYRYNGKTIMVLRQPGYSVDDIPAYLKTYKALMMQNESLVDVMVVDQNYNPGGNTDFLDGFLALFSREKFRNYAQFMRADRKWLNDIHNDFNAFTPERQKSDIGLRYLEIAAGVEQAIDAGQHLTTLPYAFGANNYIRPDKDFTWTKPVLVLANDLSGSCGDLFPTMMQRNGRSKIFGERTMGLGGSVEEMEALTNSRVVVRLTRGLLTDYREDGKYDPATFVENNGVTPDIHRPLTVDDVRSGYIDYVKAFSEVAVSLVP